MVAWGWRCTLRVFNSPMWSSHSSKVEDLLRWSWCWRQLMCVGGQVLSPEEKAWYTLLMHARFQLLATTFARHTLKLHGNGMLKGRCLHKFLFRQSELLLPRHTTRPHGLSLSPRRGSHISVSLICRSSSTSGEFIWLLQSLQTVKTRTNVHDRHGLDRLVMLTIRRTAEKHYKINMKTQNY